MSYPLFPAFDTSLAGGFRYKLPLKATPSFKSLVQTPANNRGELRVSLTQYPLWLFDLDLPYIFGDAELGGDGFQQLMGLYGAMQGQAGGFLFDMPGNDATTNEQIGTGDGVTTVFPMTHSVGGMKELIQQFINAKNLILYSQAINNSPWADGSSGGATPPTVTGNAAVAPDSTTTATSIAFPSVTGSQVSRWQQLINLQPLSNSFTYSIWLRAASGTANVTFQVSDYVSQNTSSTVALTTSWQRFSVTKQFSSSNTSNFYVTIETPPSNPAVTIYAWGAQLEPGLVMNGYVPTISNPYVYVDGVLQGSGAFAVDVYGNLTLASAPPFGVTITWYGNWCYLCRFLSDELQDLQLIRGGGSSSLWSLKSLKFKSVLL